MAGGFTGALALSPWAGACVVLVVAAGAFALLVSVVGCWALPGAAGGLLLVALLLEEALWSVLLGVVVLLVLGAVVLVAEALWSVLLVLGAVVLEAAALWSVLLGAVVLLVLGAVVLVAEALWSVLLVLEPLAPVAPVEAWLLVQESEIMFTELTWIDPSLARDPWI